MGIALTELAQRIDKAIASIKRPEGLSQSYLECLQQVDEWRDFVVAKSTELKALLESSVQNDEIVYYENHVKLVEATCSTIVSEYKSLKTHNDKKDNQVAQIEQFVKQKLQRNASMRLQHVDKLQPLINHLVQRDVNLRSRVSVIHSGTDGPSTTSHFVREPADAFGWPLICVDVEYWPTADLTTFDLSPTYSIRYRPFFINAMVMLGTIVLLDFALRFARRALS